YVGCVDSLLPALFFLFLSCELLFCGRVRDICLFTLVTLSTLDCVNIKYTTPLPSHQSFRICVGFAPFWSWIGFHPQTKPPFFRLLDQNLVGQSYRSCFASSLSW